MNDTFRINVSIDAYETKDDARQALTSSESRMSWTERDVTIDQFTQYAVNGHTFCHLYLNDGQKHWRTTDKGSKLEYMYYTRKNDPRHGGLKITFKNERYFRGAQCVFVDVDETEYDTFDDFVSCLEVRPQVVYASYSDCLEKKGVWSRRFHCVFAFDQIMTKAEYDKAASRLYDMIEGDTREEISDRCGLSPVQYMNGCCGGEYRVYGRELISLSSFLSEDDNQAYVPSDTYSHHLSRVTKIPNFSPSNVTYTVSSSLSGAISGFTPEEIEKFTSTHHNYCFFYNNADPKEWKDIKVGDYTCRYQIVDRDTFFSLFYNVKRVKDGQKRRKKLYERALLRRYIKPDVTPNELFYNWVRDVEYFFEVDKDLTVENAVRNVNRVASMTYEEVVEKARPMVERAIENRGNKRGIIYRFPSSVDTSLRDTLMGKVREALVKELYVGEDLEEFEKTLNDNGIFLSQRTIYRHVREERKKAKECRDEDVIKMYDPTLSWNKNAQIMRERGIKITDKTLKKIVTDYEKRK